MDEDSQQTPLQSICDSSVNEKVVIILAHGAGAPMTHSFLEEMAKELSNLNATVIRFNFRYIVEGRKLPSSQKKAIEDWETIYHEVKSQFPEKPIFIGGKSYGGRMASHWVAEQTDQSLVKGVFYLGFPLHSIGKPATKRANHLEQIKIPQLFLQGTNDKLAQIDLMTQVISQQKIATKHIVEHADHGFHIPKKHGGNDQKTIKELAKSINTWALDQL